MLADFQREAARPLTPEMQRRLVRALLASAVTGAVVYLLVMHLGLPALQARLTPSQIDWLREVWLRHPAAVLGAIVVAAALSGLPVLGAFRWVYGPLRLRESRTRGA
jgi:hypothetical protein